MKKQKRKRFCFVLYFFISKWGKRFFSLRHWNERKKKRFSLILEINSFDCGLDLHPTHKHTCTQKSKTHIISYTRIWYNLRIIVYPFATHPPNFFFLRRWFLFFIINFFWFVYFPPLQAFDWLVVSRHPMTMRRCGRKQGYKLGFPIQNEIVELFLLLLLWLSNQIVFRNRMKTNLMTCTPHGKFSFVCIPIQNEWWKRSLDHTTKERPLLKTVLKWRMFSSNTEWRKTKPPEIKQSKCKYTLWS